MKRTQMGCADSGERPAEDIVCQRSIDPPGPRLTRSSPIDLGQTDPDTRASPSKGALITLPPAGIERPVGSWHRRP